MFACTVEEVKTTRHLLQEALGSLPGTWAKRHEGRRTPAWVYFLGQVARAQGKNDELRCCALIGYFTAIQREYEIIVFGRHLPTEPAPTEDPMLRDVGVKTFFSIHELLTTPTAVFALVENRVESQTYPELYENCKLERCLIVSFAVAYEPAERASEDEYLQPGEFILFPTDILLRNINRTPRAYIGFNEP